METSMKKCLSDYDFELPLELIAQHPLPDRSASRLMTLNRFGSEFGHRVFSDLPKLLNPGDLLVFNESKVIPARFFGKKMSGGKVEFLIERILSDQTALSHLGSNRPIQPGTELVLENGSKVIVVDREEGFFKIQLVEGKWRSLLDEIGHIPLPPYITRASSKEDFDRYQTVYAQHDGSVAAPTAGLHFSQPLLQALAKRQVEFAFVTLHVGAGTFQPVRTENIEDHQIHQEWVDVDQSVCEKINAVRSQGRRVIAVGTTSVRALETASSSGKIAPYSGLTRLFIYPGYQFHSIDGLITNFHLPKSSLLMLVAAFAGYETMMQAYQMAIEEKYRFFSYGDGMFILPT